MTAQGIHQRPGTVPNEPRGDGVWVTDENDPQAGGLRKVRSQALHVPGHQGRRHQSPTGPTCTRVARSAAGRFDPEGKPYFDLTGKLDGTGSCSAVVDSDKVTAFFEDPDGRLARVGLGDRGRVLEG